MPLHFTSQADILHEYPNVTSTFPIKGIYYKTTISLSHAVEFKVRHCTRGQCRCHARPCMTSLEGVCVGRGRVPLHAPTIRQRVGPRYR
jgi:hypothetical protein